MPKLHPGAKSYAGPEYFTIEYPVSGIIFPNFSEVTGALQLSRPAQDREG